MSEDAQMFLQFVRWLIFTLATLFAAYIAAGVVYGSVYAPLGVVLIAINLACAWVLWKT